MKNVTVLFKRGITLVLAVMLIVSAMFVPSVVSAATETDTNYGLHLAEKIDFTKYASIGDSLDGNSNQDITADTLPLGATGTSSTQTVYYNVYGDIATLSYDIYVDSDATTGSVSFPVVYHYVDDANRVADSLALNLETNATNGNRLRHKGKSVGTFAENINHRDYLQKWLTVKLVYSNEDETYTRTNESSAGKYIKKITIIDRESNTELASLTPTAAYAQYILHYGVNTYADATLTDSDAVKIGFATNFDSAIIQNLSVTYRNNASKVIGYIDAIGEVEATEECLAAITYAEGAYALLSDTEKANVTNYATLTVARESYNSLTENADATAVVEKIKAIGAVDASEECLAKIEAAETAYNALSDEKKALVKNYDILVEARASYNAAKYGIIAEKTIDFTDYASISASVDGENNNTITKNNLPLAAFNNQKVEYTVYGNIDTLTYDLYVDSDATTGNVNFPRVYHYIDDANSGSDYHFFQLQSNPRLRYNTAKSIGTFTSTDVKYSDYLKKWITVKLEYSEDIYERNTESLKGKYISKITIINRETNTVISKFEPAVQAASIKKIWHYGVNLYNNETAKDSEIVKIGFGTNEVAAAIQNVKVTYKGNADKVIGYIDAIGEVTASEECIAKIVFAEEAYALLTAAEKETVSNYADLTAARAAYENLVVNADVIAVVEKIKAIGAVDASEECLAKIEAAETAYNALSDEKKLLVTNYDILVKARANYNVAKYGVHPDKAIDFTDYASITTNIDGASNSTIIANSLPLASNTRQKAEYTVYGDIDTLSYDIYVDSNATTGTVSFPKIYHYIDGDNSYFHQFYLDTHATNGIRFRYNTTDSGLGSLKQGLDSYSDFLGKWITIKFVYSSDTYTKDNVTSKYIKYITVIDRATGNELIAFDSTTNANISKLWKYGVNTYEDANLKDSDIVKIGFETNGVASTITNVKVTYKNIAAAEKVAEINNLVVDNSATCKPNVDNISKIYSLLPESMKTPELTAKISAAQTAVSVIENAKPENLPVINGATIRQTAATKAQNIRYNASLPTKLIDGYDVVEYGTVVLPTQLLTDGIELTSQTSVIKNDITYNAVTASAVVEDELPEYFNTELGSISVSGTNCGVRVSARSFVKYSNGEVTFILYSTNSKDTNPENPTQGINNGICNRSVYSIAKSMANAVLDTTTYPIATFGEIIGSIDMANTTGADVLEFVYNNIARVYKIAEYKQ